ncbi:MAG: hypothetical protein KKA79_04640 [Nanoarchaeota archaeon]|nr:hypothetical protein [Nanoarchaeota archaeon]MCG2718371.1 hypothetical protein [Nanoarchaeota archaeon]
MIEFIKKFFASKEETIQFSELSKWLDDNDSTLGSVNESLKDVESIKKKISENLEVLEKTDIKDAKVEDRVKTFVKGNLPAYSNAVNFFLKKVDVPEKVNHVELEIFCNNFENDFEDLNKKTYRNFQIIKEIVGKELENVAKSVKKLDIVVKNIKKDSKKLKGFSEIQDKIDFIKTSFENKERNSLRRSELEKENEELKNSCKKLEKNIGKLKNSDATKELEDLKSKKDNTQRKIIDLDNNLITLFSPFQKALKKYNNMFFVNKVEDYIQNPVSTLSEDSELEILKFLKDVEKMINENKIELKEDKKKKVFENITKLDESFFRTFLSKRNSLNDKISSINNDIDSNTVMEEITEFEKELNVKSFKVENVSRDIEKIRDVDIPAEAEKLQKRLNDIFDRNIKIENVVG